MQQVATRTSVLMILFLSGILFTGTAEGDKAQPIDDEAAKAQLITKADPALRVALREDPDAVFTVILTGPPHHLDPETDGGRAAAMVQLATRAAPFFDQVTGHLDPSGGEVLGKWSAAPAMKVAVDRATLLGLATLEPVRHIALDHGRALLAFGDIDAPAPPRDDIRTTDTRGRAMLEAEEIWSAGFRGEGIKVAVIDTGIDPTHEAFRAANGTSRVSAWADCVSGGCDSSGSPYDDHGHGTHVAGIALGSSMFDDPDWGFFEEEGAAPAADLLVAKFLSDTGGGSFEGAMDALQWSFDNGADITSNSWGGDCASASGVVQLVNQLTSLGMVSVFALGGSSGQPAGPACAETAVAVSPVTEDYVILSSASGGPCTDPTTGVTRTCPDLVALGQQVRSSVPRSGGSFGDPSGYRMMSGGSAAVPQVVGALALSEQMKRQFTGEGWDTPAGADVEALRGTALPLPPDGDHPNDVYGWGHPKLLNVLALLNASDEAVIHSTFDAGATELYGGESTVLRFSVRNVGGAVAHGTFRAVLHRPDGSTDTLEERPVSLGLLEGASMQHPFAASGGTHPGTYTFQGGFSYAWTDSDGTVQHGNISHQAEIVVRRVLLVVDHDGLPAEERILVPQDVTFWVENQGNDAAQDVRVEFTLSDSYLFLPRDNIDPTDPRSRYADPAPDAVTQDTTFGRTTLVWHVGDLVSGERFTFNTTLVGTEPGEHRFLLVVRYEDGGGMPFQEGHLERQRLGTGV